MGDRHIYAIALGRSSDFLIIVDQKELMKKRSNRGNRSKIECKIINPIDPPHEASSAVYCKLKPEHQTRTLTPLYYSGWLVKRQRVGFDTVINPDHLPSVWTALLRSLRQKLVQLATTLWDRVFG